MIRVFAIVAVLAAFGGALYLSGDYLQAWEAPQPPANAAPAPPAKKKAKPKPARPARKAKKEPRRKTAWLTQLNALCIRVLDEETYGTMEPPSRPEDIPRYIRRVEARNTRLNRQATELVQRSGDAKTTRAVRGLFDQEEQLLHSVLTAAQNGDAEGLRRHMRSLLAVGKAENRLFARLGAADCTLPQDSFDLY